MPGPSTPWRPPARIQGASLDILSRFGRSARTYPEAISFAAGAPIVPPDDPADWAAALTRYVQYHERVAGAATTSLGQYGPSTGVINDLVARHLNIDEQRKVDPKQILMTDGGQEAALVTLLAVVEPGRDALLAGDPCYVGLTGVAAILGIDVVPVFNHGEGMKAAAVAAACERARARGLRPAAVYDVPDFNNPLGTTVPASSRLEILELVRGEQMLMIEDNPYMQFGFEREPEPSYGRLDSGHTVTLGTFAKTLLPGLRVGYLVAPPWLMPALERVKSLTTVMTSTVAQAVAGGMLLACDCSLRAHVRPLVAHYRERRDRLLDALSRYFGPSDDGDVQWSRPAGGFFATMRVPFEVDAAAVDAAARRHGVLVAALGDFSSSTAWTHHCRLAFSNVEIDRIDEGVRRLSRFVVDGASRSPSWRR